MSLISFDLEQLYRRSFGSRPYTINGRNEKLSQLNGSSITTDFEGKEIWMPVKFTGLSLTDYPVGKMIVAPGELLIPYCTIKLSAKKNIVKTPMAERKGSVRELFSTDDYQISIKGFLIDEQRRLFPEDELTIIKTLFDENQALKIDNALTNIFLGDDTRVVIDSLDIPEVEGGRNHIRPFSLALESDSIFEIEVGDNV